MTISPDDPRHPARETERQNRGAPDCPVCGHTLIRATHRPTGDRTWLCLHCDQPRAVAEQAG